jgi:spore coat protein H
MRRLLPPLAGLLLALPAFADDKKPATVFDPLKIWEFHVTLSKAEFDAMQPPPGGGFRGFNQPPPEPKPRADGREVHVNVFGVEQPWAKGGVTADGKTFDTVAVRYKGNGTMMDANGKLKKSLKIDLDRHGGKDTFHGLKTLNLHCGVTDPGKCRETLTYQIYRNAGVPAPKTTLALVTLSVTGGKYDKERLGLYTLVQNIDKAFLKEHFKADGGLLLKPERMQQGVDYLGDDWSRYPANYQPKRDATAAEQQRLIGFAKLLHRADDKAFAKEVGDYLDVDAFLRFMAATAVVANMDSFFTIGHNYYLYLHPDTHKFHFLPWDVDRALANFPVFGTPQQQMDLSLTKPYANCKLADRLMAVPGMGEKYAAVLKEVCAKGFDKDTVLQSLKGMEEVVKPEIDKDAKAATARREVAGGGFGFGPPPPELKTFVEKRAESIAAQLAGKSKGFSPPAFGMGGPGGGFGGPPGGFGPGNQLARPLVERLDANKDGKVSEEEFNGGMKKLFAEWDADKSGSLDQKKLADGLQKLLPPPGGFGPGR